MKQLIEIEVDIPEGWRFVRWGKARKGETSLEDGKPFLWDTSESTSDVIIIEREAKYREPDSRDIGKPVEVKIDDIWQCGGKYVGKTTHDLCATENDAGLVYTWRHILTRVIDDTPPEPHNWKLDDLARVRVS